MMMVRDGPRERILSQENGEIKLLNTQQTPYTTLCDNEGNFIFFLDDGKTILSDLISLFCYLDCPHDVTPEE